LPVVLSVMLVALASIMPVVAMAQTSEAAADRAAREIQEARERANAAAGAFFQAESDLDVLTVDQARLQRATETLQATVDSLRLDVESVALSRFVSSGAGGIPLLTGPEAPQEQLQAEVFVEVLTNAGSEALDLYDLAQTELAANQSELDRRQRDIEAQQATFAALQKRAEDEVIRLRAIEEERLQDEAVQRALDQRLAVERAEIEAAALLEAEAEAEASATTTTIEPAITPPTTTIGSTTSTTSTTGSPATISDAAAPDESERAETAPPTTAPPNAAAPTTAPPATAPPTTVAPSTAPPTTAPATTAPPTTAPASDGIICPMPGSAYADTWGAPRSGGRSHQGVDMIAPRGIPIYAVTNGVATFRFNSLGGNSVSLVGDNGDRYYYAHLDSYAGSSRRVSQGEVIGYNGDTGNARFSTPHLHFEFRPGGGVPINPYPAVRAAGC